MEYFSNNLKFLREKSEKSQKDMAADLGFKSPSRLNNYERGHSKPEIDVLIVISKKFNVSIDDLLNKDLSVSNSLDSVKEPPGMYNTSASEKDELIQTQKKLIKALEEQLHLTQRQLAAVSNISDTRKAG